METPRDVKLILTSKIKAAVPDMSVASDVADALNRTTLEILRRAGERARLNGRRTLQSRDV
jgi:histone H3/H4